MILNISFVSLTMQLFSTNGDQFTKKEAKNRNRVELALNQPYLYVPGCPTKKFIFKIFVTQKLVKIKQ